MKKFSPIIAEFKRQRNLGEILSPSKPVRVAPPQRDGVVIPVQHPGCSRCSL